MEWKLIEITGIVLVLLLASAGANILNGLNPVTAALAVDTPALTK